MSTTPAPQRRVSSEALAQATGKGWEDWFAIVDAWDGTNRTHTEIARHLTDEHGVDGWWAQGITVGYEQEHGMRRPGQMADGTFTANASKTVDVAAEIVFDLWADEDRRGEWLTDDVLALRTATRPKSLRFDFGPDDSRVLVGLYPKGEHKTAVQVANEKLGDAETMVERKAYWKGHLEALKHAAEQYRPM
ncbi:MAG TPA: hypothetical protein VE172_15725 [Stackebrandtia sp.]|jgi:hypothetical protein|uniref:hypothetical protein n=1 Tax=Stackebrandtia sp. TaxID=2023065 RepID=UPI002D7273FB|nr:hypothetical protein [Stackebrandtia sp.]HZE40253.1 hypothetical protein [Stackebrandtia sp.]